MKKTIFRVLLPLFAVPFSLVSCNSGGGGESEDPTKVNIRVGNLDTGFGTKWIENIAARYEELHKDDVHGDKKGVKVIIDSTSDTTYPKDGSSVKSDSIDVHFRENMNVDKLIADDALLDLTEALNSENGYDSKKIIDKISEDDQKLYTMDNKIYAAPLYSGSYGIVYNKTLFKSKSLYINKSTPENPSSTSEVKFTNRDSSKSPGYDGKTGTYDDGLPRTYIEFEALLIEASKKGDTIPLGWSARYADSYVTKFLVSAYSSAAGYEQAKLRYSFDGNATNLGKISGNSFVKDLQPTTITNGTNGNGYEMMRSKAVFDALTLYKKMVSNTDYYIPQTGDFDHYTMQEYMVNGYQSKGDIFNVAMSIDGSWFYNETLKHVTESQLGDTEFGFMPIPKETFSGVKDRKYVFTDENQTCVFVKGNIADEVRRNTAIDFVKFFYSDAELINFAKTTKCVIGVQYPDIDKKSDDYAALGSFGQDVYEMTHNSYRINTNYPNQFLLNNRRELVNEFFFKTKDNQYPVKPLADKTSVAEYFNNIGTYYKEKWNQLNP